MAKFKITSDDADRLAEALGSALKVTHPLFVSTEGTWWADGGDGFEIRLRVAFEGEREFSDAVPEAVRR